MKRKMHRKLVRDKIPAIISREGLTPVTRILSSESFKNELLSKLVEEANEAQKANDTDALVLELADIQEVILAICQAKGIDPNYLEQVRKKRARLRGAFDEKIFLLSVKSR